MAGGWSAVLTSNTSTTIPTLGVIAVKTAGGFNVTTSNINTSGTTTANLFGTETTIQNLELQVEQDGVFKDKLFLRTDATATNSSFDKNDLEKLYNDNVNFYTINTEENKRLAIDARSMFSHNIPLGISALKGAYNFKVANNNLPPETKVYLQDNLMNTKTELKEGVTYNFEITTDAASKGEGRFVLSFSSKTQTTADNAAAVGIQISPNPVTDQLTISLGKEAVSQTATTSVRILTTDGQQVQSQQAGIGATTIKVQLNKTSKGLLMVEVKNDKVNSVQKVMRN